jgi:hypothetical protein
MTNLRSSFQLYLAEFFNRKSTDVKIVVDELIDLL